MNRMLDDATTELTVTEAMLESGHHLRDIVLPAATLVVMVARGRKATMILMRRGTTSSAAG